jgi:hypothetical protein
MKTPPLLLGAALLFWGWQTDLLLAGAAMAVALEGARGVRARWEISDEDFARIWTFCTVLAIAAAIYAFAASDGPAHFGDLFERPNFASGNGAGSSTTRTATALIRWLPMILFLFVAAQIYSVRGTVQLETISLLLLRRRWQKAKKSGQPPHVQRTVNVTYPYFIVCLFAASVHAAEDSSFFWGLAGLLGWALWAQRSRRFGLNLWLAVLVVVIGCSYFGQSGINAMQNYFQNLDAQWITRLAQGKADPKQSQTSMGDIGELKLSSRIVIRLHTKNGAPPPDYLREASYRLYKSTTWLAGGPKDDFATISGETNGTTWVLLRGKTNTAVVNIAAYLDDGEALLPLPTGCGRLENLPAYILQENSTGAVLAQGPGLVIFDALYGPGATIDSPFNPNLGLRTNEDLQVPEREVPALNQVISEMHLAGKNEDQTLRAVRGFFQDKFKYSLWQEPPERADFQETDVSRFLLHTRSGHCEFFASATVLLLRHLRIPARYAIGYAVHEKSGDGYVVRSRDAHAWCLVWRHGTWENFDTTPASWVQIEGSRASPLQFLSDAWSWLGFQLSKLWWTQNNLRQYVFWILIPALALLLYQIIFRKRKRRLTHNAKEPAVTLTWPGQDSEFYQLEKILAARGVPREPHEPLSAWLARAAGPAVCEQANNSLAVLLRLHYRHRFDPTGLNQADRESLRREAAVCVRSLIQPPSPPK